MGSCKDYPNVAEWKTKDTGYHTGDMVKYKSNIFRAAYWAGKEPGADPGWSLYDELYDETSRSAIQPAKVIGYLPTWRKDLDYGNAVIYQNITHGIIAFLQFDQKKSGRTRRQDCQSGHCDRPAGRHDGPPGRDLHFRCAGWRPRSLRPPGTATTTIPNWPIRSTG